MPTQKTIDDVIAWASAERIETPALLFSPASVSAAVAWLRTRFTGRISYATKANSHPWMLAELASLVDEFNVTNPAHVEALLAAGIAPRRVAYVNPVCAPATLERVLEHGVTRFVVDDGRGLRLLAAACARLGVTPRVTLRLLPPDRGESPRSVVRFGNTAGVLPGLAHGAVDAGMVVEALSFFVGTSAADMPQAMPYRRAIDDLAVLHERLGRDGIDVPTINIGGGFPGARRDFHRRHPDFFPRIAEALATRFGGDVDLLCEPGRYLSEPSLAMLTRVVADRTVADRRMVYLDASAYSGLFESSFISPGGADPAIRPAGGLRDGRTRAAVLGPIMDSFDVLKRDVPLPPLADGELLLLPDVGAYAWGYTAACEGVRAPEVVRLPERLDAEFAGAPQAAVASLSGA